MSSKTLAALPFALTGLMIAATALAPAGATAEPRDFTSGVYTEAQAEAGEDVYEAHCETCHDTDYFDEVFRTWNGVALGELFGVLAATMPQSNPGSLRDEEYLQAIAYILAEHDFPAGDRELSPYGGVLDEITVTAP